MVGENEEEEKETVTGKVLGACSSRLFRRHPLGAKPQDEEEERRRGGSRAPPRAIGNSQMRRTARVRERMGNLEKKKRGGKERCSDASTTVKKSISVEFARKIPRIFGPTSLSFCSGERMNIIHGVHYNGTHSPNPLKVALQ